MQLVKPFEENDSVDLDKRCFIEYMNFKQEKGTLTLLKKEENGNGIKIQIEKQDIIKRLTESCGDSKYHPYDHCMRGYGKRSMKRPAETGIGIDCLTLEEIKYMNIDYVYKMESGNDVITFKTALACKMDKNVLESSRIASNTYLSDKNLNCYESPKKKRR